MFIVIDCLTKILHYEPIIIMIDVTSLAKVIINMIVNYHNWSKFIISDQSSLFASKFWFLLCYFLSIKQKLSTIVYLQIDGQTKMHNNMIKAYFYIFVN